AVKQAAKDLEKRINDLIEVGQKGKETPDSFHRKLGAIIWDKCGMSRTAAGLKEALGEIPELRERFHKEVKILGSGEQLNLMLEQAGRVSDFFELAELMCHD